MNVGVTTGLNLYIMNAIQITHKSPVWHFVVWNTDFSNMVVRLKKRTDNDC